MFLFCTIPLWVVESFRKLQPLGQQANSTQIRLFPCSVNRPILIFSPERSDWSRGHEWDYPDGFQNVCSLKITSHFTPSTWDMCRNFAPEESRRGKSGRKKPVCLWIVGNGCHGHAVTHQMSLLRFFKRCLNRRWTFKIFLWDRRCFLVFSVLSSETNELYISTKQEV